MWYRNAGSKVYHKAAENWTRTGKGVCGADISKPYISTESPIDGAMQRLSQYPGTYGYVRRCKHCARKED